MSLPLVLHAPVKVNLFLEVLGPRPDGYHEVATVMQAVEPGEVVELRHAPELSVTCEHPGVPSGPDNLAARAVRALEEELGCSLPAGIHLYKVYGPGTGLGAGSADAAAALTGVLLLHDRRAEPAALQRAAARTGSDVPFLLSGGTALCRGRGEEVQPVDLPGPGAFVLCWDAEPVPTREVYAAVDLAAPRRRVETFLAAARGGDLRPFNRLQEAAFKVHPGLRALERRIREAAGRPPVLSGSGGAFFLPAPTAGDGRELAQRLRDRGLQSVATTPASGGCRVA